MFSKLDLGCSGCIGTGKGKEEDFTGAAKDFAALRDTALAFQNQEGLGNAKFKKEMKQIYEASAIKQIEVVYNASPKADGDRVAADNYMAFVREHSEANKADVAVNIAAVYYYELSTCANDGLSSVFDYNMKAQEIYRKCRSTRFCL